MYQPTRGEVIPATQVRHALEIAERFATKGQIATGINLYAGAIHAYKVFELDSYDAFDPEDPSSCARAAVNGAIDSHMALASGDRQSAVSAAEGAAAAAVCAGYTLGQEVGDTLSRLIRQDLELLTGAASEANGAMKRLYRPFSFRTTPSLT